MLFNELKFASFDVNLLQGYYVIFVYRISLDYTESLLVLSCSTKGRRKRRRSGYNYWDLYTLSSSSY